MCRQGASVIQTQVLDQVADASLRIYVAWVPILPDDGGDAAKESSALVTDGRVSQFWDADKTLPPSFAPVLGLPNDWPAWDVYLAYPAGPTWDDEPQKPAFWHHQLGELDLAPKLDGEAFARQLRELL
jgi:hypothetical protein